MCKTDEAIERNDMKAAFKGLVGIVKDIRETTKDLPTEIALVKNDIAYMKEDIRAIKSGEVQPPYCALNRKECESRIRALEADYIHLADATNTNTHRWQFIADNWEAIIKWLGILIVCGVAFTATTKGYIKVDIPTQIEKDLK